MKKLLIAVIVLLSLAIRSQAETTRLSILDEIKGVVNATEPSIMPVYDFIDHELVEFAAVDVYRDGRLSVPAGYLADDSLGIGIRYDVIKANQVTNIPVLDSFFLSPTVGAGLKDFSNVLSKPSSLTKDNFVVFAGVVGVKKFGPQGE